MKYEIKSIMKNKIFIFMLVISIIISIYNARYMESKTDKPDMDKYLLYMSSYQARRTEIRKWREITPENDIVENNWLDAETWYNGVRKRFAQDHYKDRVMPKEEYYKLRALMSLFYFEKNAFPGQKEFASVQYKDQIAKYMDLSEYTFDFDLIREYAEFYRPVHPEYDNALVEEERLELERYFYLKERDLEEIDREIASPWTYLLYSYSENSRVLIFLNQVLPIFIVYILSQARRSKTMELVQLRPIEKRRVFLHYLILLASISFIIVFLPNIIVFAYQGFKYGFKGLKNPILVYKEGFSKFSGYENLGYDYGYLGLSRLKTAMFHEDSQLDFPSQELENIVFYKFLVLSLILELLKFILGVSLGVSLGLNIKGKNLGLLIASILASVSLLSSYIPVLKSPYNFLALETGWDISLGWTQISWLGAVVYLSVLIVLVLVGSISIYGRRDYQ